MTIELDTTGMSPEEEAELNSLLAELDALTGDQPDATEQELDQLLHDLNEEMEI